MLDRLLPKIILSGTTDVGGKLSLQQVWCLSIYTHTYVAIMFYTWPIKCIKRSWKHKSGSAASFSETKE